MDPGQHAEQAGRQVANVGQQAERGAQQAAESRPVRLLGRVGLVCYGVVHLLIAYLALQIITSDGAEKLSKSGALQTVEAQPGGTLLLWTITVGMAAMAVWQAAEAVWGHRYVPAQRRALKRVASAGEAAVAALLAYSAGRLAAGEPKSSGESAELTARVLQWPGGPVLVSAAGTAGVLVVVAALTHDPEKAAGLDTGLNTLAAQPYGAVLLGVVAAGLACFGLFCLFDARYRSRATMTTR